MLVFGLSLQIKKKPAHGRRFHQEIQLKNYEQL
jgi:hypothetical protein